MKQKEKETTEQVEIMESVTEEVETKARDAKKKIFIYLFYIFVVYLAAHFTAGTTQPQTS